MSKLTQEGIKAILNYCPDTGVFTWAKDVSYKSKKGMVAGHINDKGYRRIGINKTQYKAHRLAWLYVYGEWPNKIDHCNGIRDDNRIINIRNATSSENAKNICLRKDSKNKIFGVNNLGPEYRKKYKSVIKINKKVKILGCYDDFFEACCVRKSAEAKHGFHANHGRK